MHGRPASSPSSSRRRWLERRPSVTAVADLAAFVTHDEANRLVANLALSGDMIHMALTSIDPSRRVKVGELLREVRADLDGDRRGVRAVLEALGGVPQAARPQLVWTAPSLPGAEGNTTLAVSELIHEAMTYVYAATFSATTGSAYVVALHSALERGVKVTLVVDREHQKAASKALVAKLPGARVWTLKETEPSIYAVQHAKIVMIDGLAALVTSANFSTAAADNNLECGILLRDTGIAKGIRTRLDSLHEHGYLVEYSA